MLVIEVSQTTLTYDRDVKVPLYALHELPEVWLFDIDSKSVSIFRNPGPQGYRSQRTASNSETIVPALLPNVAIALPDIWQ